MVLNYLQVLIVSNFLFGFSYLLQLAFFYFIFFIFKSVKQSGRNRVSCLTKNDKGILVFDRGYFGL